MKDGKQSYPQGFRWERTDPDMLGAVIDAAFDYRGDVTLLLDTGEEVKGYLANRNREVSEPYLEIYPADGSPRRRLPYSALQALAFTGKDPAAGKSWATWLERYRAKKAAEARGEKVESLGLFPEPLD